jgi:hypothetical protein
MELAYAAHSARCALLLDAEGVCRWFLLKVDDEGVSATAKRCVGAQFVATLDPDAPGLLGPEPEVGKSILFARVDDGRVSLVRFGPLVQFDTLGPSPRAVRAVEEREAPPASLSRPVMAEPALAPVEPVIAEPVTAEPVIAEPATAEPVIAEPVVAEPATAEPEPATAEVPRLSLVPTPPTSEPSTLPSGSAHLPTDDVRETQHDLFDEDELATAVANERRAYRSSGFAIRAHDSSDGDNIETAAFSRAIIVPASRRGMLPHRG